MIKAKQKGGKGVVEVEQPDDTNVVDLMESVRNSLKGSATGGKPAAKKAGPAKKAPVKKPVAKKRAA
jgi:DNA end-binding protein Ku